MRYFPRDVLEAAIRDIEFESVEDIIQEDYNGRGYYGAAPCFGIVYEHVGQLLQIFLALSDICSSGDGYDSPRDMLYGLTQDAAVDSVGLDQIVYFPNWQLTPNKN